MANATRPDSADACPVCGRPMEVVHFKGDGFGLMVLHGPPPDGLAARLLEPLTGSLVTTEAGSPVLWGIRAGHKFPAHHCPACRQIILRYRS